MKNTILRDCLRISREKLPNHPQLHCWPHFTFIIQNNSIVEWATNSAGTPDRSLGYHTRIEWGDGSPKLHSELNCYKKAKGLLNKNKPFEAVNLRLSRSGNMRLSAPCSCCYNFLGAMGCRMCIFSTDFGFSKMYIET
jgi:hypothetical protein